MGLKDEIVEALEIRKILKEMRADGNKEQTQEEPKQEEAKEQPKQEEPKEVRQEPNVVVVEQPAPAPASQSVAPPPTAPQPQQATLTVAQLIAQNPGTWRTDPAINAQIRQMVDSQGFRP